MKEDGGRTWLQYWLWCYYNPKHLLGWGKHEGDWEVVQIGLDGETPDVLTYSQHENGEARDWDKAQPPGRSPDRLRRRRSRTPATSSRARTRTCSASTTPTAR